MQEIKLYRSPEVDKAWQKRKSELEKMWKEEHPQWELVSLFQDYQSMVWLSNNGVEIDFNQNAHAYILKNDYKYEGAKEHYTFIPFEVSMKGIGMIFADIYLFCNDHEFKDYAIVKKSEGSINYPHWHLLIY